MNRNHVAQLRTSLRVAESFRDTDNRDHSQLHREDEVTALRIERRRLLAEVASLKSELLRLKVGAVA